MRFLLIILFLFSISCDATEYKIVDKAKVSSRISEESRPSSTTKISSQAWQGVLSKFIKDPFEKVEEGSILTLTIKNTKPYDVSSFDSFLIKLGVRLYEFNAPFSDVSVKAAGSDETYLKAKIHLSDVAAHTRGEISQPELLRRCKVEIIETIESLTKKVRKARKEGLNKDAKESLEKWVEMEPQSIIALSLLGNVNRDEKKYWDAIAVYKKIAELEPQSMFAWHNLAYSYDRVGAFDDSIEAYKKVLLIKPKDYLLMQQLTVVYRKDGNLDNALSLVKEIKKIKETAELLLVEGNIHRDAKRYKSAKKAYEKAKKLNPADQRALFNLLLIDIDTKQYSLAKKKYAELKKKDPSLAGELAGIYLFQDGIK